MAVKNRKCSCCKTQYRYCPSCGIGDPSTPWKYAFCSENCRDMYQLFDEFVHDKVDGIEAKKRLEKIDLSNVANFGEYVKKAIMDISAIEVEPEPTVEVEPVVPGPIIEIKSEEQPEVRTFSRRDKRRNKIVNDELITE